MIDPPHDDDYFNNHSHQQSSRNRHHGSHSSQADSKSRRRRSSKDGCRERPSQEQRCDGRVQRSVRRTDPPGITTVHASSGSTRKDSGRQKAKPISRGLQELRSRRKTCVDVEEEKLYKERRYTYSGANDRTTCCSRRKERLLDAPSMRSSAPKRRDYIELGKIITCPSSSVSKSNATKSKSKSSKKCTSRNINSEDKDLNAHIESLKRLSATSNNAQEDPSVSTTPSSFSWTTSSMDSSSFNAVENKRRIEFCKKVSACLQKQLLDQQMDHKQPPLSCIMCVDSTPAVAVDIAVEKNCDGFATPPRMVSPPRSPPPTPKGHQHSGTLDELAEPPLFHGVCNASESHFDSFNEKKNISLDSYLSEEQTQKRHQMSNKDGERSSEKSRTSFTASSIPSNTSSFCNSASTLSLSTGRLIREERKQDNQYIYQEVQQILKRGHQHSGTFNESAEPPLFHGVCNASESHFDSFHGKKSLSLDCYLSEEQSQKRHQMSHKDGERSSGKSRTNTSSFCNSASTLSRSTRRQIREDRKQENRDIYQQVQQILKRLAQEQEIASAAWSEVAKEYHRRVEPFTSMFVPNLLDPLHLKSPSGNGCYFLEGKTVLDVASGTGAAALYAASRGARSVTATDFSENMLEVIRRRIAKVPMDTNKGAYDKDGVEGITDAFIGQYPRHPSHVVETVLADGLCLPKEWTDQYDIVCSNFGVIYFPRINQGIAEMAKCAKAGTGKVCISGWGTSEETQAFRIFPAAMKLCGFDNRWFEAQSKARKELLESAGVTSGSREERRQRRRHRGTSPNLLPNYLCPTKRIASSKSLLCSLLKEADLVDVEVVGPITHDLRVDSAEEYWNRFVLASPNLKRVVEKCLTGDEALQLKKAVFQVLKDQCCFVEDDEDSSHCRKGKNGVVLQASAYIAVGTKKIETLRIDMTS